MKMKLLRFLLFVQCFLLPILGFAFDFKHNSICYNIIDIENQYVEVTNDTIQYVDTIVIPSTVTYANKTFTVKRIGQSAFNGCKQLKHVKLPNTITQIGDMTNINGSSGTGPFVRCGITEITIPNSVEEIDNCSFNYCDSLKKIIIEDGNSIIKLGCGGWLTTWQNELCGLFAQANVHEAYIGRDLDYTVHYPAYNYTYSLPPFKPAQRTDCSPRARIQKVIFGDSVTIIPTGMFSSCPSLREAKLGINVVEIKSSAFQNVSIDSITFPNKLRVLGASAFSGCNNLRVINGIENIDSLGSSAFSNCNSITSINLGEEVNELSDYCFANCSSLSFISIPENVTRIGKSAFQNCSSLSSVILPKRLNDLGSSCFYGSDLRGIAIPDSVSTLNAAVFSNCGKLSYIKLPISLESIGNEAFANCVELTNIVLPECLSSIGENAFKGDNNLMSIVVKNKMPIVIPENSFQAIIYLLSTLCVPIGCKDVYSTADVWKNFSSIIEGDSLDNVMAVSLTLNKDSIDLYTGDSIVLDASILPQNTTTKSILWFSENNKIATVDSTGMVSAIAVGFTNIIAMTTDGSCLRDTCVIRVLNVPVESISLENTEINLTINDGIQINAFLLPDNAGNKNLSWASNNNEVAMVDNNGFVTAVGIGSAVVTATTVDGSNLSASCRVTVMSEIADNCFVIPNVEVLHGDTLVIPVCMNNVADIIAFQTDIFLPQGFEIIQEDSEYCVYLANRASPDHVISCRQVSSGAIRVVCYTNTNQPFSGDSGNLFYITVSTPNSAAGDYTINLKNSFLTTSDFNEIAIPDAGAVMTVKTFIPGDANDSRTVTVTDIVSTVQYILEMNPSPFIFDAADMNADGNIRVTDLALIANIILNPSAVHAPMRMPALWDNSDSMSAEDISLSAGQTRRMSIYLDNLMSYTAFQFDLQLSAGLTASNFSLTDRTGSHSLDVADVLSGKTRVLCYSPELTAIDGNEGALLTFDLTAAGAVNGNISVDDIELVTTDCQTVLLDSFNIGVNQGATAVSELGASKAVSHIDYYNLSGQQLTQASDHGVTIVVTTYTDGTRIVTKVTNQ